MDKKGLAVITGADGGMGSEITRAVAQAGYPIVMACRDMEKAENVRQQIIAETGNTRIECLHLDLASLDIVAGVADFLLRRANR